MNNDERFEALMRDAAQTYRTPPQAQLDEMWTAIEAAAFDGRRTERDQTTAAFRRVVTNRWTAIAATLVIGVALGRASMSVNRGRASNAAPAAGLTPPAATHVASASTAPAADAAWPYDVETSKYLGQTAALLIALPTEARAAHPDDQFIGRASELLSRTRLLMDSPAASDAQLRALLEDLELVLAQIVRLQDGRGRTEIDLINHALEQRDVLPRLRSAVADFSAN